MIGLLSMPYLTEQKHEAFKMSFRHQQREAWEIKLVAVNHPPGSCPERLSQIL